VPTLENFKHLKVMTQTNAAEARELGRLSTDCSFLLTHLIRQNDSKTDDDARKILASILNLEKVQPTPLLRSSTVGWYGRANNTNIFDPITRGFERVRNTKAVCFTESTLSGLKAHRDMFGAKYGVAFDRDLLFSKGANPCINIRDSLLRTSFTCEGEAYARSVFNFIPSQLHPFVNVIHDGFDATHEREWRVVDDLSFELNEIFIIFCPVEDFAIFSELQSDAKPLLFDLAWLDRV
jgi:Putative abortive phage resistance protein AbiGi, antitoxin